MSPNANQRATRQQVIEVLSQLVGLRLTVARRAADMRTFQFGDLRPVDRGTVGEFALHVQCPWRIEGPIGIVTGRLDLWEPLDEQVPYDEKWHYDESPNLQDARMEHWFAENKAALVVKDVDADDYGGAAIILEQGYVVRLFPAGTRGEDWRLFRPKTDIPHLVICAGAVESDGNAGALT
jgi:hypothetical protein